MTTRHDQAHWHITRRARPMVTEPAFIPLKSHVAIIRGAIHAFEAGKNLVVVSGPSGSGRTMVARQVARLVSRQPIVIEHPGSRIEPTEKQIMAHLQTKLFKNPPLFVFDSIQLKHVDWAWWLRDQANGPAKLLVVSSTAWWIEHSEYLKDHAEGLGLKLLSSDEIAHLSNGLRWIKTPTANPFDPEFIQSLDEASEGLARSIVHGTQWD